MNEEAIEYCKNVHSAIKDFCLPLQNHLQITLLMYFKIYHDSSYILLSNDLDLAKEYYSKVHKDNLLFEEYLENTSTKSKYILWPQELTNLGNKIIFNRNYCNGLTILRSYHDHIEFCNFLTPKNNIDIYDLYIKHSNVLDKFAEYFKLTFNDIIAKAYSHRATYRDGFNFYLPKHPLKEPPNIRGFLKSIGMENREVIINGKSILITSREKDCLELIDRGYTLHEIAEQLSIGLRTVETHLNKVKEKTGLYFRHDLAKLYRNFLSEDVSINTIKIRDEHESHST